MNELITIQRASVADMDEIVAIDDDACELYASVGLRFDFGPEHPFARSDYACWREATLAGRTFLAVDGSGTALGLLIVGDADGAPHLEQLSVRRVAARRGLGRRLVRRAIGWAGDQELWLTTYAHVPWNRPFYEQEGFAVVPEPECGPEVRAILAEQRRWLPDPEHRVAMRRAQPSMKAASSSGVPDGKASLR